MQYKVIERKDKNVTFQYPVWRPSNSGLWLGYARVRIVNGKRIAEDIRFATTREAAAYNRMQQGKE